MRVCECLGDFAREAHRIGHGERALAIETVAQRLAGCERHDVVDELAVTRVARVEQGENVRVIESRGDADLAQEPFARDGLGQFRMQHLDRDLAMMLEIVREEHGGHAAGAELALDAVAVGERSGEAGEVSRCGHLQVWRAPGQRAN